MSMLRKGLCGEPVRILQQRLSVDADGIFGAGTDAALRAYQKDNGLEVDGIAGPDTFTAMGLHELVLLQRGIRGETVKKLQTGLGISPADGIFGAGTEKAVREFQASKGIDVDGMAGPQTLALVDGFGEITQETIAASVVTENTQPTDPSAIQAAAAAETPPPEHPSFVAKVEEKVATVGKTIWNTVKSIF
jgi:peptidoglycan hydrolase-like protein with peptidoglycan-binding domain